MADGNPYINEARESLETFTREQIIGPGAFNKRFFLLADWSTSDFTGKKLESCQALENVSEIISEVPAYQYSSAILFPRSIEIPDEDDVEEDEAVVDAEDENDEDKQKADDENFRDDHTENTSSKNQNYPNTCGISFSLSPKVNTATDLSITLSFRTYRRLSQDECREKKLGYWVPDNKSEIARLIAVHLAAVFATEVCDDNLFVYVRQHVDVTEYLHDIDYLFLEQVRITEVIPKIIACFPGKDLFKHKQKRFRAGQQEYQYTTIYDDSLIAAIKDCLTNHPEEFDALSGLIHSLELYNQLRTIVTDLKTIYRKPSARSKPTPIYQSSFSKAVVSLPEFSGGIARSHVTLDHIPDLWIYYQLMKTDAAIFVKLIAVNKNSIKLKRTDPPQLNKKHEANTKSFFGVELRVDERVQGTLVPYNPPNLLAFDEEQNFAKLVYRRYEDFGEGHNTSVHWAKNDNQLRYIRTEFIPEEDVPKVDFEPRKVVGNKTVPRMDGSVLQFRRHSTLSDLDNQLLLAELKAFVDNYEEWIREKAAELNAVGLDAEASDVLHRQLKSCEADYMRMVRNIRLMNRDSAAMAAYRTMNTAMFMQLHHSISTKDVIKHRLPAFLPNVKGFSYYADLELSKEYQWRPFQLAFILLNIDGFVKPRENEKVTTDVFSTGWPERNEIADLVWFPTGGGKTEAYLGLIAFCVAYRRFTKGEQSGGTTVLMRYTLRLLTLQQFQRATLLICALEVMRKQKYPIAPGMLLGLARITIGLFVGRDSAPNRWSDNERGMDHELEQIQSQLSEGREVTTKLPHTECPWCGGGLFTNAALPNVFPLPNDTYGINSSLKITCNTVDCAFYAPTPLQEENALPFRLFDEDVYKFPPTLLFGTVDKFAALANRVSTVTNDRNNDSRRLFGKGPNTSVDSLPPELIIQDELHLLLGPLGSAVGLFEKAIDSICSYTDSDGNTIRPKVITSTATTRNTDKQIFALFERRSEIFPKQGITSDDSFFSFYERSENDVHTFASDRRYLGLLPSGKTQVWMQLRIASICMVHRLKFIQHHYALPELISGQVLPELADAFDYYHTILSYFNSLKEVGKTQSQLAHYLPGDINLISGNVLPWCFLDHLIRKSHEIEWGELTGRLTGERVKTSMKKIESRWKFLSSEAPPEFVISTNMISVGIDISRLNLIIINSMPRNTAEYIQASSRVARKDKGLVFTIHHPFRSRDISHYQRFREFHEKFYGYVEPISVTPFASKALTRYLAMYVAVIARHNVHALSNNIQAANINPLRADEIMQRMRTEITRIRANADALNTYLQTRELGQKSSLEGIIGEDEFLDVLNKASDLVMENWLNRKDALEDPDDFVYRHDDVSEVSLFNPSNSLPEHDNWNVKFSLREIAPSIVIKTVQQ
jgi:hypothetical protein